ncbi:DUF3846 domain-containing protein [Pseudoclavibacter sp. VKM Ac-2867]|uniref:DUF3846 domain-containing protein n=1 Tax=Pseudoclavibacter sp. VKM Ac-2867 TaxID=2783829 RepID=UPI00188C4FE0|nr:DUF3846 domain-containing protein [Pseudoclavibacter sp. VKM Ac-2867]MBF4459515.1 DUF3846 domain-containing protein [Pseudoclavibacter sp. VKM Ac-2867]
MPYPITVVVIPPTGDIAAVTITKRDPLGQFQRLVGGDIEAIAVGGTASGYVHAEGFYEGLPINHRGLALIGGRLVGGDMVQGTLVVTGLVDEDGVETSADVGAIEQALGVRIPVSGVCACGHRIGVHQFPLACNGAIGYLDDQARCDCTRDHSFLAIMTDRKFLKHKEVRNRLAG